MDIVSIAQSCRKYKQGIVQYLHMQLAKALLGLCTTTTLRLLLLLLQLPLPHRSPLLPTPTQLRPLLSRLRSGHRLLLLLRLLPTLHRVEIFLLKLRREARVCVLAVIISSLPPLSLPLFAVDLSPFNPAVFRLRCGCWYTSKGPLSYRMSSTSLSRATSSLAGPLRGLRGGRGRPKRSSRGLRGFGGGGSKDWGALSSTSTSLRRPWRWVGGLRVGLRWMYFHFGIRGLYVTVVVGFVLLLSLLLLLKQGQYCDV